MDDPLRPRPKRRRSYSPPSSPAITSPLDHIVKRRRLVNGRLSAGSADVRGHAGRIEHDTPSEVGDLAGEVSSEEYGHLPTGRVIQRRRRMVAPRRSTTHANEQQSGQQQERMHDNTETNNVGPSTSSGSRSAGDSRARDGTSSARNDLRGADDGAAAGDDAYVESMEMDEISVARTTGALSRLGMRGEGEDAGRAGPKDRQGRGADQDLGDEMMLEQEKEMVESTYSRRNALLYSLHLDRLRSPADTPRPALRARARSENPFDSNSPLVYATPQPHNGNNVARTNNANINGTAPRHEVGSSPDDRMQDSSPSNYVQYRGHNGVSLGRGESGMIGGRSGDATTSMAAYGQRNSMIQTKGTMARQAGPPHTPAQASSSSREGAEGGSVATQLQARGTGKTDQSDVVAGMTGVRSGGFVGNGRVDPSALSGCDSDKFKSVGSGEGRQLVSTMSESMMGEIRQSPRMKAGPSEMSAGAGQASKASTRETEGGDRSLNGHPGGEAGIGAVDSAMMTPARNGQARYPHLQPHPSSPPPPYQPHFTYPYQQQYRQQGQPRRPPSSMASSPTSTVFDSPFSASRSNRNANLGGRANGRGRGRTGSSAPSSTRSRNSTNEGSIVGQENGHGHGLGQEAGIEEEDVAQLGHASEEEAEETRRRYEETNRLLGSLVVSRMRGSGAGPGMTGLGLGNSTAGTSDARNGVEANCEQAGPEAGDDDMGG